MPCPSLAKVDASPFLHVQPLAAVNRSLKDVDALRCIDQQPAEQSVQPAYERLSDQTILGEQRISGRDCGGGCARAVGPQRPFAGPQQWRGEPGRCAAHGVPRNEPGSAVQPPSRARVRTLNGCLATSFAALRSRGNICCTRACRCSEGCVRLSAMRISSQPSQDVFAFVGPSVARACYQRARHALKRDFAAGRDHRLGRDERRTTARSPSCQRQRSSADLTGAKPTSDA